MFMYHQITSEFKVDVSAGTISGDRPFGMRHVKLPENRLGLHIWQYRSSSIQADVRIQIKL